MLMLSQKVLNETYICSRAWCRDYGARIDRQKARLMWLVETMGADAFREKIGEYMGVKLRTKVEEKVSADRKALTDVLQEYPSY